MTRLLLGFSSSSYAAQECLVFAAQDREPYKRVAQKVTSVIEQAGICVRLEFLPQKRLALHFSKGKIDAEIIRVPAYGEQTKSFAFMVPEPLAESSGLLITRNFPIVSLEGLRLKKIGILRGVLWPRPNLRAVIKVHEVTKPAQLLKMLELNRIDAVLTNSVEWKHFGTDLSKFHVHEIADLSAHIFLRKNRMAYKTPINDAISAFRAKGGSFLD